MRDFAAVLHRVDRQSKSFWKLRSLRRPRSLLRSRRIGLGRTEKLATARRAHSGIEVIAKLIDLPATVAAWPAPPSLA